MVCYKLSFHEAVRVQPCLSKPFGIHNRTANKLQVLSSGIVSSLALHPRLLVQNKLVTPLEQTAGRDERLAHIRDFPSGFHIASSACLDSKASLAVVLDV